MIADGIFLAASGAIITSCTALTPQAWRGGRSALTIAATQFAPNVTFQIQAGNGVWIPVCSTIVSSQIFPFDAPPGQYRIVSGIGSSIGLVASLNFIPQ